MLVNIIKKIFQGTRMLPGEGRGEAGEKHFEHSRSRDSHHEKAVDHFDEISGVAEAANSELAAKNRPFRFEVKREGDSIYISVLKTALRGETEQVMRKNITHYELYDLVKNLENLEGMLMDTEV